MNARDLARTEERPARLASFLAAVATIAFMAFVVHSIARDGLCCADDAWFATVAKNLANGDGYATSLQIDAPAYSLRPFDGAVGSGPALIIPAAALIRVLGNRYWVPAAAAVLIWSLSLAAAAVLLRPHLPRRGFALAVAMFPILAFTIFAFHFEHWRALIGEIPAASLVILAIAWWSSTTRHQTRWIGAGVLFALAVLVKLLALLWAASFVIAAIVVTVSRRERVLMPLTLFGVAFAMPILLFELWSLITLGFAGFRRELLVTRTLGAQLGVAAVDQGQLDRIAANLATFVDRFGLSAPLLLIVAAAAAAFCFRHGGVAVRRCATALFAGVVIHMAWWIALCPPGQPRYVLIALVPLCVLLVLPVAAAPDRWWRAGAVLTLLVLIAPALPRVKFPFETVPPPWFVPSPAVRNTGAVARFLERNAANAVVLTEWWAMAAPVEYASRQHIAFQPFAYAQRLLPAQEVFMMSNERWLSGRDQRFLEALAACGSPVLESPPYRVFRCSSRRGGT